MCRACRGGQDVGKTGQGTQSGCMATYSQAFGMILCSGAMQKFMPKAIPLSTSFYRHIVPNGTSKIRRACWFFGGTGLQHSYSVIVILRYRFAIAQKATGLKSRLCFLLDVGNIWRVGPANPHWPAVGGMMAFYRKNRKTLRCSFSLFFQKASRAR